MDTDRVAYDQDLVALPPGASPLDRLRKIRGDWCWDESRTWPNDYLAPAVGYFKEMTFCGVQLLNGPRIWNDFWTSVYAAIDD